MMVHVSPRTPPRVKRNRLRKAQLVASSDTTTIGEYEYFGDTRRSKKTVTNHGPEETPSDGGNTTVLFYYCGIGFQPVSRWNICETRNGSNQTTFQHLWGTQYTDELIWLEKNGDPTESNDTNPDDQTGESTADMRYFVHQDRNWNVTALTEYDTGGTNNGRIAERYSYTPYGQFVVLGGDSGNGELGSGRPTSTVGNVLAHQGLPMDHDKCGYQNRRREHFARVGRFAQRQQSLWVGHTRVDVTAGELDHMRHRTTQRRGVPLQISRQVLGRQADPYTGVPTAQQLGPQINTGQGLGFQYLLDASPRQRLPSSSQLSHHVLGMALGREGEQIRAGLHLCRAREARTQQVRRRHQAQIQQCPP